MKRRIHLVLSFIVFIITLFSAVASADECFYSSKKMNEDAQMIRLKAIDMGWKVGKTASLAAAAVVSGKSDIYPQDNVEICLRQENNTLQIKVQSESRDARKAGWHKIVGREIKNDK